MAAKKKRRSAPFEATVAADDVAIRSIRLGDAVALRPGTFFGEHGLTILQYNVLRILYVQDPAGEGLPTGTVGAGLMVRGPDVTRRVDRLEKAGHLERFHHPGDRRIVNVRFTGSGIALVETIHGPLVQHNRDLFARVPERELERLARLLGRALEALGPGPEI